ncbi:MAG: hypothetical protein SGPRY_001527, partial [Prymnesium sp.]
MPSTFVNREPDMLNPPQERCTDSMLPSCTEQDEPTSSTENSQEIARGHLSLRALLHNGQELVGHQLPLHTTSGGTAFICVSLFAYESLRRVRMPLRMEESLRFEVCELTLLEPLKSDPTIQALWVEIDALELNGSLPMKTKQIQRTASRHEFDFSQTVHVGDNCKALERIRLALSATDEQEADIYFALKASTPNHESEVAQGYVSLKNIEKMHQDHKLQPIDMVNPRGIVTGRLNVAVAALGAIKKARSQQTKQHDLHVAIHEMSLTDNLKRDPEVREVWVEVDLLGLAEASQLRTKKLHKSATSLDFGFSTSVTVGAGSKGEEVLRTALASKQEQDADVYFVVKTLTARNQEREVCQGYVNLQALLREGRDASSKSVALQGKSGSAGSLTVS